MAYILTQVGYLQVLDTDLSIVDLATKDHDLLDGLLDDDHTQYSLVDGTRSYTGKVTISRTANDNLTNLLVSNVSSGAANQAYVRAFAHNNYITLASFSDAFAAPFAGAGAIYTGSGNNLLLGTDGGNTIHVTITPGGLVMIRDTANAKMTQGLTINQGAHDDEILALKSSDVGHGRTTIANTTTYAAFLKAQATSGGLKLRTFKDADGDPYQSFVLTARLAENADTTKSSAGKGIIDLRAAQTSGDADQNIVADGNILSIGGYIGGAVTTVFIIDEDGDTWQSGIMTAVGATIVSGATPNLSQLKISTTEGMLSGFVQSRDNIFLGFDVDYIGAWYARDTSAFGIKKQGDSLRFYANGSLTVDGAYTPSIAAYFDTVGNLFLNHRLFVNETANANMTAGITINQGGAGDEILALKSSDVGHGIIGATETDTFGYFDKLASASGGLEIVGLTEATIGLSLVGMGVTDDTSKDTGATAYIVFDTYKKDGEDPGEPGANANLLVIKGDGTAKWLVDMEGDTWQSGLATMQQLTFIDGGSTVDIVRDEDNMVSDDDAALATQQSIKAYVDTEVAGAGGFPSGTKMWFYQASAPTGWTIDNTLGDRVLAVHGTSPYSGSTGGGQQQGGWTITGLTGAHSHNVYVWATNKTGTIMSETAARTVFYDAGSVADWWLHAAYGSATHRGKRETTYSQSTTAISSNGAWRPAANVGIIASKD